MANHDEIARLKTILRDADALWKKINDGQADRLNSQDSEIASLCAELAHLEFCLDSRDDFIGNEGLWDKYVGTLPNRMAGIAGGWSSENQSVTLRAAARRDAGTIDTLKARLDCRADTQDCVMDERPDGEPCNETNCRYVAMEVARRRDAETIASLRAEIATMTNSLHAYSDALAQLVGWAEDGSPEDAHEQRQNRAYRHV